MYQLCPLVDGQQLSVKRLYDNAFIPFDTSNNDYQEYLKWLEQGNTPEPAEPIE